MTLDERLRDKLMRHGLDSPNAAAGSERDDYMRAARRPPPGAWLTASPPWDSAILGWNESASSPAPQLAPGRRRVGRVLVTLLSDSRRN